MKLLRCSFLNSSNLGRPCGSLFSTKVRLSLTQFQPFRPVDIYRQYCNSCTQQIPSSPTSLLHEPNHSAQPSSVAPPDSLHILYSLFSLLQTILMSKRSTPKDSHRHSSQPYLASRTQMSMAPRSFLRPSGHRSSTSESFSHLPPRSYQRIQCFRPASVKISSKDSV